MSDYYRLEFEIQPFTSDAADLLAAFLAECGFESFEKHSDNNQVPHNQLFAYVQTRDFEETKIKEIVYGFPMDTKITWTKSLIGHTDWNEEWEKHYFKPLVLAEGRCVVHSSFHTDYPHADIDVVVDPKMAFGTGHHATTSMMVSYLFDIPLYGKKLLDMGAGTAILAIIANKLGAAPVYGIEIDVDAYENALENAASNHAEIVLLQGDASRIAEAGKVDVFLANINRNIILQDLQCYIGSLAAGGQLLLSGFYDSDVPLITKALEENGMSVKEVRTEGDSNWAAVRSIKEISH